MQNSATIAGAFEQRRSSGVEMVFWASSSQCFGIASKLVTPGRICNTTTAHPIPEAANPTTRCRDNVAGTQQINL
jgi:hypothetical protein